MFEHREPTSTETLTGLLSVLARVDPNVCDAERVDSCRCSSRSSRRWPRRRRGSLSTSSSPRSRWPRRGASARRSAPTGTTSRAGGQRASKRGEPVATAPDGTRTTTLRRADVDDAVVAGAPVPTWARTGRWHWRARVPLSRVPARGDGADPGPRDAAHDGCATGRDAERVAGRARHAGGRDPYQRAAHAGGRRAGGDAGRPAGPARRPGAVPSGAGHRVPGGPGVSAEPVPWCRDGPAPERPSRPGCDGLPHGVPPGRAGGGGSRGVGQGGGERPGRR